MTTIGCVNPDHDHTTYEDGQGGTLDVARPMTCNDCALPTHYSRVDEWYHHDDASQPVCFLAPEPSPTPCTRRDTP